MKKLKIKCKISILSQMSLFTHIKTGNLYQLVGMARCHKNPLRTKVVYKQMFASHSKAPYGYVRIRNSRQFIHL
jgi:hypothetical protein